MSKTKPPKLDLSTCEDKKEAVELWLDQFNDWCILQDWRDTEKAYTDRAHWKTAHYASEISAFRLALPLDVLKMVKSTIVPTMSVMGGEENTESFIGNPWVWQNKLLSHYAGQDTVLADRMNFLETCKQKPHETISDFEARCKHLGSKCEYNKMTNPEQELIRDRFVTGIYNDKLRAELLRHKKDDGTVVTLDQVVNKAKAWEAANNVNTKVMEAQHTDEHVNYTARSNQRSRSNLNDKEKGEPFCGYCGQKEFYNRKTCPAGKPGVHCRNCYGANHFAIVCRSPKDHFKKQWMAKGAKDRQVNSQIHALETGLPQEELYTVDQGLDHQYALSVDSQNEFVLGVTDSNSPKKLFTSLSLSIRGNKFQRIPFQVDSAATCNTLPYDMYLKLGKASELKPTKSTLFTYCGSPIKPLGTVTLVCETPVKFECISFEVIDSKNLKPALLGVTDSLKLGLLSYDKTRVCASSSQKLNTVADLDHAKKCDDQLAHGSLTKEQLLETYAEAFTGLGKLGKPVSLVLDPEVKPVHAPIHRIPVSKRERVKKKLDEMVAAKKLAKVEEPTDWCSNMTVVETVKENGEVKTRLCLDPSQTVNKAIIRPKYTIPTLQELLPDLSSKKHKCFTIMDALDGFTQVELDEQSSLATTMQTPWGRYRWLRLPYGISSAPEEFQMRIHEALDGLTDVFNIADDMLIYGLGDTPEEASINHDKNLISFMQRAMERNLKLNPAKIQFKLKRIVFMGHIFTEDGILPDPNKVKSIVEMPTPEDKKSVQRFIGMVNYLHSFCPALSDEIQPLQNLLKPDVQFLWSRIHEESFQKAKSLIASAPCLSYFDDSKPIVLQVDASETGLGGVMMQPTDQGKFQPVAYTSSTMRPNEILWAQIEKETLAICAACEKWDLWLYGKKVTIHTDHQPLETIFKKPLAKAPKRLQRLMMRLQRYSLDVVYKKGSSLVLADTLSRAPLPHVNTTKQNSFDVFRLDVERLDTIPNPRLLPKTMANLQEATLKDPDMVELTKVISSGWPNAKSQLPSSLTPYWCFRDEMSIHDGIIYRGSQAIIPRSMRKDILARVHVSHAGAESNIRLAKDIIYWPGMQSDIKDVCQSCGKCAQFGAENRKEPMKTQPVPQYPWQFVSQDLLEFESDNYLVTVDHFSDFIELDELDNTLSLTIINLTKAHFARHGIPEVLLSDNGPQFISTEFASFCDLYGITHITSSPYWPKGNGKAESAVKIVKSMMKKCTDLQLALLLYRNTPQEGHTLSPAQRCMGRRTRLNIPQTKELLVPDKAASSLVQTEIALKREKAKRFYDRNAGDDHPDIPIGDYVYGKPRPQQRSSAWQYGQIIGKPSPRSYVLSTPSGTVRRNRAQVRQAAPPPPKEQKDKYQGSRQFHFAGQQIPVIQFHCPQKHGDGSPPAPLQAAETYLPEAKDNLVSESQTSQEIVLPADSSPTPYKTRSGRVIRPPKMFDPSE